MVNMNAEKAVALVEGFEWAFPEVQAQAWQYVYDNGLMKNPEVLFPRNLQKLLDAGYVVNKK